MKPEALFWLVIAAISLLMSILSATAADLPNVPGAFNPAVTQANIRQTVCVSGWTKTVRPRVSVTNRIKLKLLAPGERAPASRPMRKRCGLTAHSSGGSAAAFSRCSVITRPAHFCVRGRQQFHHGTASGFSKRILKPALPRFGLGLKPAGCAVRRVCRSVPIFAAPAGATQNDNASAKVCKLFQVHRGHSSNISFNRDRFAAR